MLPFYFIMTKITQYIAIILLAFTTLNAQYRVDIKLSGENNRGQKESAYFGVAEDATYGIDSEFSEFDFPGNPFPNQIFMMYFRIIDEVNDEDLLTYRDYKPAPKDSNLFYRRYELRVDYGANNADTVTLSWSKLPKSVVSAFIYDSLRFGLDDFNMIEAQSVKVNNRFNDKFLISILFDRTATSVEENGFIADDVYYDRDISAIVLPNKYIDAEYEIVDLLGRLNAHGKVSSNLVHIKSIVRNQILLFIARKNGEIIHKKFFID